MVSIPIIMFHRAAPSKAESVSHTLRLCPLRVALPRQPDQSMRRRPTTLSSSARRAGGKLDHPIRPGVIFAPASLLRENGGGCHHVFTIRSRDWRASRHRVRYKKPHDDGVPVPIHSPCRFSLLYPSLSVVYVYSFVHVQLTVFCVVFPFFIPLTRILSSVVWYFAEQDKKGAKR